ncbi:hypothetical protein V6N13_046152 [Hibiscus sabdariffa]|uniref:Uncharacterized protein n=2 Tax=Hibiscus sabdariffa TaxID=183260 RepID=A0ABR2B4P6_9ROSI
MSDQEVDEYRKSLAICVSGFDVPRPVKTFEDCGFAPELMRAIAKQGPDHQTLLFPATIFRKVEKLAREIVSDPIREIGEVGTGTANVDITQLVHVIPSNSEKLAWND